MNREDIDKACEWLEDNLYATVKINKGVDVYVVSRQPFLEKFKQAMKGGEDKALDVKSRCINNVMHYICRECRSVDADTCETDGTHTCEMKEGIILAIEEA